jgi:predicted transcriptional regulator
MARERLQFFVDDKVVRRLDELAKGMDFSRNEAAAWLVRLGVSDEDWVLNQLTARVNGAFRGVKKQPKPV